MHAARGNANLSPKTKFTAIGKLRRSIVHDNGRVDLAQEAFGRSFVFGDNAVGVMRAMCLDMVDGLIKPFHHAASNDGIEIFELPVFIGGGHDARIRLQRCCITTHFTFFIKQHFDERREMGRRDCFVDKQSFSGPANTCAPQLGISNDGFGLFEIGEGGVALDQANGKVVWKSADKNAGYSTPLPLQRNGQSLAVFGNGTAYVAVQLADGKEAWRIRWVTEYGVNASDPIIDGDRVFVSSGYGKGGGLYQLGAGEPKELWKSKKLKTQLNAAVLYQGHLYGVDGDTTEKAALKCLEFATGEEKWAYPGFGSGGVTVADGKLIALTGTGELMVAPAAASGFKPSGQFQVLGGKCWTAPVLANGRIYCRNGRGDVAVVDVRKN